MANQTLKDITLLIRNDTAANWESANPTLSKGELGIEIDTAKIKVGDGATKWNDLKYSTSSNTVLKTAAPTSSDYDYEAGTFWINTSDNTQIYFLLAVSSTTATWVSIPTENGSLDNATTAEKLKTARKITLSGAVVEVYQSFDGSGDIEFNLVLNDSGVTAGTFTKFTVNSKGIITSAEKLTADDLPDGISLDKISGLGTAAAKDVGTTAGDVPTLGTDGKLDSSLLPAIAITDVWPVNSEAEMLALDAHKGDMAIRSDVSNCYILAADDPTVLANWLEMLHPACAVESVNGKIGVIVLTTDNIEEGNENLYFTPDRFEAEFEKKESGDLKNGDKILTTEDTLTLDCGNAEE